MNRPKVSKWLAPSPVGQISRATPTKPSATANTTRRGSLWRRYSQPSSANQRGIIPIRIAAIPDGTVFSPNTTNPLPIPSSSPPTPSQGSPAWQPVASLPWAKGDIGAWAYDTGTGYEISGRIVIAGGGYPVPDTAAFIYNPASNSWKTVRPLLVARNHHVAIGVGGRVYVIGGRIGGAFISSASNNVDLVEMYDPATDLWTPRARMPTARSAIGGGVYNGNILVAGGEGQDQRFLAAFKAVDAYDPARNQWQALPSMPHPRHGLAVGAIGNRLYTVSGDGQSAGNGIEHSAVAYNEILQVDLVLK